MDRKHSKGYRQYLSSDRWRRKSKWVRSLTRPFWLPKSARGRCVLFPWCENEQTHHLTYYFIFPFGWNWWGFEFPCWHLVPLSKAAHDLVGHQFLWTQPVRAIINLYLRLSFCLLWTACQPIMAIPTWIGLFVVIRSLLELGQPQLAIIFHGLTQLKNLLL